MSIQSTGTTLSSLLLFFLLGFSLPGQTQNCVATDPVIGRLNPGGDMFSPTVTTYCAGGSIGVFFSDFSSACPGLGNYNPGNQYLLEMSDANGSFAAPITLITSNFPTLPSGVPTIVATGSFSAVMPANVPPGSGYSVRLRSTNPVRWGTVFGSTITILAAPVQPDFGATLTVVQNGSLTLTNTAACSGTVVWGRTNGDMATGTGSISVPTAQTGPVSYTATCRQACGDGPVASLTATVNTDSAPTNPSLTSGTLTCAQTSLTLTGSATNAVSYTLSSAPGSGTTNTTGRFSVSTAGTYTLTAANSSGVTASTTATVAANTTAPMPITLLTSNTLTCAQTTATLTVVGLSSVTYAFSGPGLSQNGPANTAVVNQAGTFSVTITGANGCTSTFPFAVSQDNTAPAPSTLTASNSGSITCQASTLTLTATPVGSLTYTFIGPGLTQTSTVNTAAVSRAGIYTLITTNAAGCTTTTTTTISSNTAIPGPVSLAATNGGVLTCGVSALTLTASPASLTYAFSASASQLGSTNQATVSAAGTYSVLITGANNCTASASVAIFSNTTTPTATLASSNNLDCTLTSATLTAGGGNTYSFGGPGLVSQNNPIGTAIINTAGIYSVTATNTASGCFSTTTLTVSQTNAGLITVALTTPNTNLTTTAPTALLTATPGAGTYRFVGPGLNQTGPGNTATGSQAGVYSVTAGIGLCATTASITLTGSGGPGPAPSPFVVVTGVLSCATPTVTIEVIGGDQFSFTDANGTQNGIVSVFDGSFRDIIGEGYRLVRTPIPTNGRAVVNKPGTYTITARNGNSLPTQIQVVVTGVACL